MKSAPHLYTHTHTRTHCVHHSDTHTPSFTPHTHTHTHLLHTHIQMSACSESQQVRARLIAERLKMIGDKMQTTHNTEELEQNVSSLIALTSSVSRSNQNLWQNVTLTFSSIYTILSNLNQQFGDSQPPSYDEDWQMFCKVCSVLRNNLIPLISSLGGWVSKNNFLCSL